MHGTRKSELPNGHCGSVHPSSLPDRDYTVRETRYEDPVKNKDFSFSFPKLTIPLETIIRITLYCYLIAACMKYLRG